jgi:hypothetical protein
LARSESAPADSDPIAPQEEQGRQDSNLRHLVLETSALPAELRP